MSELEIIKQARETLLMCSTSVEERSPAGKELKKTLAMINEYLQKQEFRDDDPTVVGGINEWFKLKSKAKR